MLECFSQEAIECKRWCRCVAAYDIGSESENLFHRKTINLVCAYVCCRSDQNLGTQSHVTIKLPNTNPPEV